MNKIAVVSSITTFALTVLVMAVLSLARCCLQKSPSAATHVDVTREESPGSFLGPFSLKWDYQRRYLNYTVHNDRDGIYATLLDSKGLTVYPSRVPFRPGYKFLVPIDRSKETK